MRLNLGRVSIVASRARCERFIIPHRSSPQGDRIRILSESINVSIIVSRAWKFIILNYKELTLSDVRPYSGRGALELVNLRFHLISSRSRSESVVPPRLLLMDSCFWRINSHQACAAFIIARTWLFEGVLGHNLRSFGFCEFNTMTPYFHYGRCLVILTWPGILIGFLV
jgi:hypothetical protein